MVATCCDKCGGKGAWHNTACILSVATNEEVNNLTSYYCLECKVTAKEFS